MSIIEIFLIGISLSMDAFAVSICIGLSMNKVKINKCLIVGLYFGLFQAIMPLFGFLFGNIFKDIIINVDHFIILLILTLIGINMIFEKNEEVNDDTNFKTMLLLSIATSIDAFAVGITFSFLKVNIFFSIFVIGLTTFIISFLGVLLGNKIGMKYQRKAKVVGGITLIILGIKILLEHLNII